MRPSRDASRMPSSSKSSRIAASQYGRASSDVSPSPADAQRCAGGKREPRDVGIHRVEHAARERVHAGERDVPVALEHQHRERAGRLVAQKDDGARRQRLGRRGHARQ
jgi:hypothetical protein